MIGSMTQAPGPSASSDTSAGATSAWSPLRRRAFAILWIATALSNIGAWMQNAASGWLMTSLSPAPLDVALVQAATTLPMFLFSLPAGALADIVDRRRLLIVVQVAATVLVALFAALVGLGLVTPNVLLAVIFLSGVTTILAAPAWQAIVPQLVPHNELTAAVALNGVGFNISRAIGPALGGVAIAGLGMASPFWFNAASNLIAIAALYWWRPEANAPSLPAERFLSAIRGGLRYARYNRHLRATLVRSAGFFPLASVYWALLPLVARSQIAGGPELYGVLLGAIGAGAVAGAFALPAAKARLGADRLVAAATAMTALALVLFAIARDPVVALVACALAGMSWIAVIATLNVSAQLALPAWVRGRGLAAFATVQFAGLAAGSAVWGQVAQMAGLPATHAAAAVGLVALIPLLRRWHLQTGAGADLTPSMHWPTPVLARDLEADRGPVLVTIEYVVAPGDRSAFLAAIAKLAHERQRDGAYEWGIYEDPAHEGVFMETFQVDSWLEHMRQHHRVTNADRLLQDAVHRFHAEGTPVVRHFIAATRSEQP
jgi:predicted MFS family arabinose efflux permease